MADAIGELCGAHARPVVDRVGRGAMPAAVASVADARKEKAIGVAWQSIGLSGPGEGEDEVGCQPKRKGKRVRLPDRRKKVLGLFD